MKEIHLIVVEDSEEDRLLLLCELEKKGYKTKHIRVESAGELREALRKKTWDMISDHALPGFSAPEALTVLKESGRDIPFIIVSGAVDEEVAIEAVKAGAHDYIMKGNPARLAPVVERELREAALRSKSRQVAEAYRESEAELEVIYQNAPMIMMLLDRQKRVRKANGFTLNFNGRLMSDMAGLHLGEALCCFHAFHVQGELSSGSPCDQCAVQNSVMDTFKTGRNHHQIEVALTVYINGEIKELVFLLSTTKLFVEHQPMVLVSILNITERKLVEEALSKSETRFRFLAENAKDIIFQVEIEPELKLSYISPSVNEIIGYTPQELCRNIDIIHGLALQTKQTLGFSDPSSLKKPLVLQCEHKEGHAVWLELYLSKVLDDNGHLVAVEGIARDITERELKDQQLKNSYAKIEALSNRILSVMEEERARLARELHDQLGQVLTAVKLDLQLLSEELIAFQRQREKLSQSINLIDTTLQLVRRQSVSLRPPTLDDMGILPALRDMIQGFMDRTGVKSTLQVQGFSERLPLDMETALYRCVQESLTNVARHAKATKVNIDLKKTLKDIEIQIEDNGIGFQLENLQISPDHIGLTGMQERVKLLHGAFDIDSEPGRGTRIQISVPWPVQNKEEVNAG